MARSCVIIPQVRNPKTNETEDSKLFKDLLSFTKDRKTAVDIYGKIRTNTFKERFEGKLKYNELGEPTIKSLIDNVDLKSYISDINILNKLNEDIGNTYRGKLKSVLNTKENIEEITKKIIDFNNTNEFNTDYVAIIGETTNGIETFIYPEVVKKTIDNKIKADKIAFQYNLNKKLTDILAGYGVSVGVLDNLEEKLGINGITDFDTAKTSAEGFIELIRIAKGEKGEKALPEEFSHVILEILKDNPLVNRLYNLLNDNPDIIENILGDNYENYKERYKDDKIKLLKEASAKLLTKHLINNEKISYDKPYKILLNRFIQYIKSFFSKWDIKPFQSAIIKAEEEFNELAKNILEGNIQSNETGKSILEQVKGQLFQLEEKVNNEADILKKIIETEKKRYAIYSKRKDTETFKRTQSELISELEKELLDKHELEGIFLFLKGAVNIAKQLQDRLSTINSINSLQRKASIIRDINNYIASYENILKDVQEGVYQSEELKDNKYTESALNDLNQLETILKKLRRESNKQMLPLFKEAMSPYFIDNIVIPFGKNKGKVLSFEEMMTRAEKDLSIYDTWLTSMAHSSNMILKIFDQAVKKSKDTARLKVIDKIHEIESLGIKLEQSGIKDTDWMYKRDKDGNITGQYIKDISNLSNAQKEFYNSFMKIKQELDAYLPEDIMNPLDIIKVRKDLFERVKDSKSIKKGISQIGESLKDKLIRNSNDVDIQSKNTLMDFNNREFETIPIYYTSIREDENLNDLSTDAVSTLIAYADMAINYNEMNKIVDILEIGRDLVRNMEVQKTSGGKPLKEIFKTEKGRTENPLTIKGENSNIMKRLNNYMSMQVYNKYIKDEGTFFNTNIDKAKTADLINQITSLNNMAFNILSGISNIATGKVMMRIESFSKQFFTEKDTIKADKIYAKELPSFLGEIGNRVKISKLALFGELFNVLQDFEQEVKEVNFNKKNWFTRRVNTNAAFMFNNAGEHWMQFRTALALANTYKMKSSTGEEITLWDALEVKYLDENNHKLGAKLKVKDGYTKIDGSEFTEDDIFKFSRRAAGINQNMHGIYNKLDRNAIQSLAIGRLAIMYRKWIVPSLNRRFKGVEYNLDTDAWSEGFYNTAGRFLIQLMQDAKKAEFHLISRFKELTPVEKNNIRRFVLEIGQFAAVAIIGYILKSLTDGDRDRPWLVRMAYYQSLRLYTEIGAFIPVPAPGFMLSEGFKILKSPAAGINTLESSFDLIKLMMPWNYMDEIQAGRFKGHSTAYKTFFNSPILIGNKTIYRGLHPEEGYNFFQN